MYMKVEEKTSPLYSPIKRRAQSGEVMKESCVLQHPSGDPKVSITQSRLVERMRMYKCITLFSLEVKQLGVLK